MRVSFTSSERAKPSPAARRALDIMGAQRRKAYVPVRCGFIGLGIMGKALAGNLAPKGLPTIVYDIDEAAIREVVAGGAGRCRWRTTTRCP
jgi:phosphoglycerate dehydrogenase-like enzyme